MNTITDLEADITEALELIEHYRRLEQIFQRRLMRLRSEMYRAMKNEALQILEGGDGDTNHGGDNATDDRMSA
jgi:hypothetical protein